MPQFTGIWPALFTPFGRDGKVNHAALETLIDINLQKGVDGFYVCGSSGEAFLLSRQERCEILETVIARVSGRAGVIAHVGCIATQDAIALAEHAQATGADAISSVSPFYYEFTFDEIAAYYGRLSDAADLPVILYNFPAQSKVSFTLEQLSALFAGGRLQGIKHTSSDFFQLERIKCLHPDVTVFNGYDEMLLSGLAVGADGAIGSTFNFMAERFVRIYSLTRENRWQEARAEQAAVNAIISTLVRVGVLPGIKALLGLMGLDFGCCREPFQPPNAQSIDMLKACIRTYNLHL